MSEVIQKGKSGQTFYAIAFEHRRGKKVRPGMDYFHAKNPAHAKFQFLAANPTFNLANTKIIGIAPVVGYGVNDNHGDRLIV